MDAGYYLTFADCFVRYEERTRTIDNDDGTTSEETYLVAIPLTGLPEIYSNLERSLGRTITAEDRANASEIYYRVLAAASRPTARTSIVGRTACRFPMRPSLAWTVSVPPSARTGEAW